MMDLALNNPFQSFEGKELYPSVQAKAARLCFGLVKIMQYAILALASGDIGEKEILQWIIKHQK